MEIDYEIIIIIRHLLTPKKQYLEFVVVNFQIKMHTELINT